MSGHKTLKVFTRRVDDYLRAIHDVTDTKGYTGTNDLAEKLRVRLSSVTEMLRRMNEKGLVIYEKYRRATLTLKGYETVRAVKMRHDMFMKLLESILVLKETVQRDTHELEHRLHPKTIEQLTKLVGSIAKPLVHPR